MCRNRKGCTTRKIRKHVKFEVIEVFSSFVFHLNRSLKRIMSNLIFTYAELKLVLKNLNLPILNYPPTLETLPLIRQNRNPLLSLFSKFLTSQSKKRFILWNVDVDILGRWIFWKLCNGQRGEGVKDFVTHHYVYFEGDGGMFSNSYVTADTQFEKLVSIL